MPKEEKISINPAGIVDAFKLIEDIQALTASLEGQAVLADIAKLVADFKNKTSEHK